MKQVRQALSRSPFRSRFHLDAAAQDYVRRQGEEIICRHAAEFVRLRLAPAAPTNDGRQTPMRGHPVFVAQHACACCCRGCLAKWHGIPEGRTLSAAEQSYIVSFLWQWIAEEMRHPAASPQKKKPRTGAVQGEFDFGEEG